MSKYQEVNRTQGHLNYIQSNKNNYYYDKIIETKKRVHKWGTNHAKYVYHTERVFDQSRYGQDLRNAQAAVNAARRAYEQEKAHLEQEQARQQEANRQAAIRQQEYQQGQARQERARQDQLQQEASQRQQKAARQEAIRQEQVRQEQIRQQKIAEEQNKFDQTKQALDQVNNTIQSKKAQIVNQQQLHNQNKIQISKLAGQTSKASCSIQEQENNNKQLILKVVEEKVKSKDVHERILNHQKTDHDNELRNNDAKNKVKKLIEDNHDDHSRTELLVKLLAKPVSETSLMIIEQIYSTGFDVDLLAYIAVTKNDEVLIKRAIEAGADFVSFQIKQLGDRTLLQYMLDNEQDSFLEKTIQNMNHDQLVEVLLSFVDNDNAAMIYKVLSFDNSLATVQIKGISLLQHAICYKNINLVEELLKFEPSLAKAVSVFGESTINFIARSLSTDVFNVYAKYIDITNELKQLIDINNTQILNGILLMNVLDQDQKQELLQYATSHQVDDEIFKLIQDSMSIQTNEEVDVQEDVDDLIVEDEIDNEQTIELNTSLEQANVHSVHINGATDNNTEYLNDLT